MKKTLAIFIVGLLIRLAVIPVSLHPDFRAVNLAAYFISQKGQLFSFYDTLSRLPRNDSLVRLYGDDLFIYPPLAYLTHALFNKMFFPFYPQTAFLTLITDIGQLRTTPGFPILMYWLKLPYLLADILCFWLLIRYIPNTKYRLLTWLWWFNPVVIYTSYLMGQFDIFVALFILLAYLSAKGRSLSAGIFLGVAAGFKPFPLILLPLLPGSRVKNITAGLVTYLLIIAPYLGSPAFRQYALLAGQSDKMFFARIPVSGSQYLPLFLVGLILVYWWNFFRPRDLPLWAWMSAPLLLFYSVTHFHPQWFTWIIPLLVVGVSESRRLMAQFAVLILCYFGIVLFFEPSLNFGLFGVDFSLSDWVGRYYSADFLVSLIRGILAATSVYILLPGQRLNEA